MDTLDEDGSDYSSGLMQALLSDQANIGRLTKDLSGLVRVLRDLDPVRTAATISGLLARPELQANCYRLEVLAHLVVRHATGTKKPNRDTMMRVFRDVGVGQIGMMEDPSEDVFVSVVSSQEGNFRVFGGITEGAAFYLHAFLDVVDSMPSNSVFDRIKQSTYGLLRLSEAVAERMALQRHALGEALPQKNIPSQLINSLSACRRSVTFSNAELLGIGVDPASLRRFAFSPSNRVVLDTETLGHTSLERRPVILTEDGVVLALPTAISAAIRRNVIETCRDVGAERELYGALTDWHAAFLNRLPILGGSSRAPVVFSRVDGIALANFGMMIDAGRWLHVLVFMDDFVSYEDGGLNGSNADPERLGLALQAAIDQVRLGTSHMPGFREGLSLVVTCGWGRGLGFAMDKPADGWRVQAVRAHDLETLSNLPGLRPTTVWRTLDMVEDVRRLGLRIWNASGLLNLVAWARGMNEHLVPHSQLPTESSAPGQESVMVIDQSSLRIARHEAALAADAHRLPDTEGRWVAVRRVGNSDFAEDANRPEYAADEEVSLRSLRGASVTPSRTWWIEVSVHTAPRMTYKYWEMLLHWLGEAAPVLEIALPGLPDGPIRWLASFEGILEGLTDIPDAVDPVDFDALVSSSDAPDVSTVSLKVAARFQGAFYRSDNAAERALLASFTMATARLAGIELTALEADVIAGQIVKVPEARHIHMFHARTFRQHVSNALPSRHVAITKQDDAHLKLGMGWRARNRSAGPVIQGKADCMAFLNATVADLEKDLCVKLKKYQKRALLQRILLNHEATAADRAQWMDTSAAIIGLRHDEAGARLTLAQKESERNAVFLASRILVEAAMCEASNDGEDKVGDIDLARLMAMASGIVQTGGWSNAIRWDAMGPELRVSPMGEILTASTFEEKVLAPLGQESTNVRVRNAIADYSSNYEPVSAPHDIESALDCAFLAAWQSEFGFSLEQCRAMIGLLEDRAVDQGQALLEVRRSELLRFFQNNGLPSEAASSFVNGLSMMPRSNWKAVPEGYRPRDIEAWRFRRRLSLLRRPLLWLSGADDADPELLVVPGLLAEALNYQARSFHDGDFDKSVAVSEEMRSWIGATNHRQGKRFNSEVAERMRSLGWEAESDVEITRLLRKGFDKNYGDVDVLAWNRKTGRVLLIECKDLLFGKTHGEVAEQMSKFRGEVRPDGKPDLLRKHLNRMEVTRANASAVKNFTGCALDPSIECHLVFRYPVPMKYAWEQLAHVVQLNVFADLQKV